MTQYPDIILLDEQGAPVGTEQLLGAWFVLYFYPKDNTSGCTKESQEFQALKQQFDALNCRIIGVSKDNARSHLKFQEKYGLEFTLLVDDETILAQHFGIWVEKSMYGRKYMGVERSTFLFNERGELCEEWRKVKVPGHAQIVLDSLKNYQQ